MRQRQERHPSTAVAPRSGSTWPGLGLYSLAWTQHWGGWGSGCGQSLMSLSTEANWNEKIQTLAEPSHVESSPSLQPAAPSHRPQEPSEGLGESELGKTDFRGRARGSTDRSGPPWQRSAGQVTHGDSQPCEAWLNRSAVKIRSAVTAQSELNGW